MNDDPQLYANRDEKLSRIVHCEINALLFANLPIPPGATLYTTPFMSCDRCAVVMLQAGLRRFVAPKLDAERALRWKESCDRSRSYIAECGGTLLEL